MTVTSGRRLLLVHAHPDDESIGNGATMAKYAAEGAHVTLVTCTLGEEGEVIPPELAHLAPDRDDTLGPYRIGELAAAMAELGVADHRFLGGPGRYRDSGMMGVAQNKRPGCFWQADLDEAAGHLLDVIREVRPQVLVTYDPNGGYGHPDHIQAHRVAMRAAELAAEAGIGIDKVYWNCIPRSEAEAGLERLRVSGVQAPFEGIASADDLPGIIDDSEATAVIDRQGEYAAQKTAAMKAHASQIAVDGFFFALSNDLGQPLFGAEYYRLVRGTAGPAGTAGASGAALEDDLFAGLDTAGLDTAGLDTAGPDAAGPDTEGAGAA